jgi:glutaredoxin
MTTICPKCRAVRPMEAQSPAWQCPACGVAYAKASGDAGVQRAITVPHADGAGALGSIPWFKLFAVLAIAYGAWLGYQRLAAGVAGSGAGAAGISHAGRIGSNPSSAQLGQLAASAKASDVLVYSAPWCSNCAAAKAWMAQYGFQYTECDVQASSACLSQLKSLDPLGGVPYLIVKGQHMKNGFDSDEFLAALAR